MGSRSRLGPSAHSATVPGLWRRGLFSVRWELVVRLPGLLGVRFEASWEAGLEPLGVFLGPLGSVLGPSSKPLGASLSPLGASWGLFGAEI